MHEKVKLPSIAQKGKMRPKNTFCASEISFLRTCFSPLDFLWYGACILYMQHMCTPSFWGSVNAERAARRRPGPAGTPPWQLFLGDTKSHLTLFIFDMIMPKRGRETLSAYRLPVVTPTKWKFNLRVNDAIRRVKAETRQELSEFELQKNICSSLTSSIAHSIRYCLNLQMLCAHSGLSLWLMRLPVCLHAVITPFIDYTLC